MEKIYMNNNQNQKKSFFQTKLFFGLVSFAIILLLVVAAIVVVGFDKPAYAIPTVDEMPNTFVTADVTEEFISNSSFTVSPYYVVDSDKQVYCAEHNVEFKKNTTFNRSDKVSDYGLLSLMVMLDDDNNFKYADGSLYGKELRTWITQVAIWDYLNKVDPNEKTALSEDNLNKIRSASSVCVQRGSLPECYTLSSATPIYDTSGDYPLIYETKIVPLVTRAMENRTTPNNILKVEMADGVSLTSDNKYYQTNLVTVKATPAANFNGFAVSLEGSPEGSFVVDTSGNKIENLSEFTAGSQFYVRVPVSSVKEDSKVLRISVVGSFKSLEGYNYTAENAQTISAFRVLNTNVSTGRDLELNYTPPVPDTGMSTAQTIYFIGLIVLLSGIGVIYANVKPTGQE